MRAAATCSGTASNTWGGSTKYGVGLPATSSINQGWGLGWGCLAPCSRLPPKTYLQSICRVRRVLLASCFLSGLIIHPGLALQSSRPRSRSLLSVIRVRRVLLCQFVADFFAQSLRLKLCPPRTAGPAFTSRPSLISTRPLATGAHPVNKKTIATQKQDSHESQQTAAPVEGLWYSEADRPTGKTLARRAVNLSVSWGNGADHHQHTS